MISGQLAVGNGASIFQSGDLAAELLRRSPISLAQVAPHLLATLVVTLAAVLAVALLISLLSRFDQRSRAVLRLDWFLPQMRRSKSGEPPTPRLLGRVLRRWLPNRLRSDHASKQRGGLRRGLRKLGISWLASPPRRVVQAICLIAFLVSFFYVCWPYDARPASPPQSAVGLRFDSIDQQSGLITFEVPSPPDWLLAGDRQVYLSAATADSPVGRFRLVATRGPQQITLIADEEIDENLLASILTDPQPWVVFDSDPEAWPAHYAENLAGKEWIAAELFLTIDPLVSLSTAIASRSWVWSLLCAAIILLVCLLIPRGFCGYVCPLGTTIDLFDWAIGSKVQRLRVPDDGWWVHIKYYLLAGTLIAALAGVLVSGFVAAIPVITRGMLFFGGPLQSGTMRGWHLVPAWNAGHWVSIAMFAAVLGLGFFKPRFWCKYVCPSGAVFSLANLFRVTERKVESSCIHCNKCVEICPFDAIKPDFTTRETDCTLCQSCGGVCPTHAIKFVERWNVVELKVENDPPTGETPIGRRGFLSLAAGTAAAAVGGVGVAQVTRSHGARLDANGSFRPVRPPGSVPEQEFLQMCIRCGECFKACPNDVLQPEAFEQGLEGLWTPLVQADWAGCESSCNACGQVCPTGAIRALPLEEKRVARMGLAIVNESTCLPFAQREACDLCVVECQAAGYNAIEYTQVGTRVDEAGRPIDGSGYLAPVVLPDACVGCGLCQTRCYAINVKDKQLLMKSAIIVEAGEGKEDRMMRGSYRQKRIEEKESRQNGSSAVEIDYFVPDESPKSSSEAASPTLEQDDDNPFGI